MLLAEVITPYISEVKYLPAMILLMFVFQSSLLKRKYMLIIWKAKACSLAY